MLYKLNNLKLFLLRNNIKSDELSQLISLAARKEKQDDMKRFNQIEEMAKKDPEGVVSNPAYSKDLNTNEQELLFSFAITILASLDKLKSWVTYNYNYIPEELYNNISLFNIIIYNYGFSDHWFLSFIEKLAKTDEKNISKADIEKIKILINRADYFFDADRFNEEKRFSFKQNLSKLITTIPEIKNVIKDAVINNSLVKKNDAVLKTILDADQTILNIDDIRKLEKDIYLDDLIFNGNPSLLIALINNFDKLSDKEVSKLFEKTLGKYIPKVKDMFFLNRALAEDAGAQYFKFLEKLKNKLPEYAELFCKTNVDLILGIMTNTVFISKLPSFFDDSYATLCWSQLSDKDKDGFKFKISNLDKEVFEMYYSQYPNFFDTIINYVSIHKPDEFFMNRDIQEFFSVKPRHKPGDKQIENRMQFENEEDMLPNLLANYEGLEHYFRAGLNLKYPEYEKYAINMLAYADFDKQKKEYAGWPYSRYSFIRNLNLEHKYPSIYKFIQNKFEYPESPMAIYSLLDYDRWSNGGQDFHLVKELIERLIAQEKYTWIFEALLKLGPTTRRKFIKTYRDDIVRAAQALLKIDEPSFYKYKSIYWNFNEFTHLFPRGDYSTESGY